MPETLTETLREVIGDTVTPQESSDKDTAKGQGNGETNSGATPEKEFVGGVDISDIPEQDRPRIRELLSKKVALFEKGAQPKLQEVAKLKKFKDDLLSQGLTEDEAVDVLKKHIEGKKTQTSSSEKKEAIRTLDKMIEESDDDTRSSLKNLRQIIKEEGNTDKLDALLEKVDKLEKFIGYVNQDYSDKRVESVTNSLNALCDTYGKEFIDEYREEVMKQALQFPKADTERLLAAVADPKKTRAAILSQSKEKPNRTTQEKLNAISSPGSGRVGSVDDIDVTKYKSHKSLLTELLGRK